MVFRVPNTPDVSDINQSEPDNGDFVALGERRTGILTGGSVAAQGVPGMSVQVGATTLVIADVPYSFASGAAVIGAPASNPRFDLVGWTSAGIAVVPGTPSSNPTFPTFDPTTFCLGAAVYVKAGVSAITTADIVAKGATVSSSLRRTYASNTDTVVEATAPAGQFKVTADGTLSWGSNVLKRTGAAAMELVSRITLRGGAILKARASSPETEKLLSIESDGGTELAYITGTGKLSTANFKFGTGTPNGVVTAARGTVYIDEATPTNQTFWIKSTTGGNTGWVALREYSASESALPTGTIVPWIGMSTDTIPAGFVVANGGSLTTGGANAALFNLIQYRFGGTGANFNLPDLRGRFLYGAGGAIPGSAGALAGASMNGWITLSVAHLPPHNHGVNDPGHVHPQAGPYWYYRSNIHHNNRHPYPTTSLVPPHLWVEEGLDKRARTGISLANTGGGQAFNVLPPSTAVTWLIKL